MSPPIALTMPLPNVSDSSVSTRHNPNTQTTAALGSRRSRTGSTFENIAYHQISPVLSSQRQRFVSIHSTKHTPSHQPGAHGRNEIDTHADTCWAGANFCMLAPTVTTCEVSPF